MTRPNDLGDAFGPGASLQSSISAAPPIAASAEAHELPPDVFAVNLMRLAGLDKHKARECEAIVRQVLAANARQFIQEAATEWKWHCSKCGVDRLKAPCPKGHHAALTGECPMVGQAAHGSKEE